MRRFSRSIYGSLYVFVLVFSISLFFHCGGGKQGIDVITADLVLTNCKIVTVDRDQPAAEAAAVWKGRIIAVGSSAQINTLTGPDTTVIDLKGKLLLPGFNDCHTHMQMGGFHLLGVDLKDAENEEEFGKLLAAKSKEMPPGTWITGGSWDHDKWPGGNLPTAELIDRYVPDRPVFVMRYDGHMSVANSLALEKAGITAATPDPPGGTIDRIRGTRKPAGVLRDNAIYVMEKIIPPPTRKEIRLALETALDYARRHGITSIQQMDMTPVNFDIYQQLAAEGKLTARIYGMIPIEKRDRLIAFGMKRNFGNEWISIGGVKGFMDGSLGSSTAMFFEPYTQDPSTSGLFVVDRETMKKRILEADKAGLQVAIHSIGDKSNHEMLSIFSEVIKENGPRDRRFRIEHAQHMLPDDYKRFTELGVIASMQPYHAIDDGRFAEKRIGYERCKQTYAFNSFLRNKAILAFGSDWPVAPLEAIVGIYAAVTRRTLDDKNPGGWFPEQKITVEQAIEAFTLTAAYAQFQEDIKGSITVGKLADMVVLSEDILTIPPEKIEKVEVLYTIVNGKIVYQKQ
jgi:predicted amidohydrolase YtcJ